MKKSTLPFFLFCMIISFLPLRSQTTFRFSYDAGAFDISGGMVQNPAGEFVLAGINNSFGPYYGDAMKVDASGNVVWAKAYTGGFATNFTDIKNVSTGGYIMTGSSTSGGGGAILVRIDDTGALLWAKRYQLPDKPSGNASNEYGNAVIETSDGGFLVGGGVDYFWDGVSATTVDTTSAMGFKVDASGNLLWSKVWTITTANPDEHYINDVAESADGYFFVGQSSEGSGTLNSNGDYPSNALVIKTTTAGALTYIRRWGVGNTTSQSINSALKLSNGNILLGGIDDVNAFLVTLTGTGAAPGTTGLSRKINGAAFPPRTLIIQDIMENSDGNYSVIGMQIDALSFSFYTAIYKLNSSTGALIFGRGYTPIGLSAILPEGGLASDQGYYVGMTDQQTGGFNYNIIRTDATGQLGAASGCGSTSLTPATAAYSITLTTPTSANYNLATAAGFTPTVSTLTPTVTQHCLTTVCTPPAAATTVTATPATICAGQSTSITASGPATGVTYNVYAASSGGASLGSTPFSVSPGTTTTYYIETAVTATPTCVSTTRTPVTVTVNPLPTPTAGSNSPLCVGGTLNLTSSGGTTYSWAGPNSFSSTSQNPSITGATVAASGTYTVTATSGGCSATATVAVTVNAGLTATAGSNTPVCDGSAINLTATGGVTYSWAGPNSFSSTSQNPTLTASPAAAGTYTVTVSSGSCSATSTTVVAVTPLPAYTIGSNTPVCENGTINLISSGGGTYSWTGPNSFSSTSQNPSVTAVTAAGGTYTLTVTASGCSASATTTVAITPSPVITTGSNTPVCENGTVNLTATGGGTYSWTGPNSFTSTVQNPSLTAVATAGGTYTVTVTAIGCSATSTTAVVIIPTPVAVAGSNAPVCNGTDLNLTASGGTSYLWSGPNGFTSGSQNPTITGATATEAGTYTVTVTSSGCSATATTLVNVTSGPTGTAGSNTPVCENSSINLTASGGSTYSWAGPNGFSSSSQNPSLSATTAAAGTYTVTVSISGCSSTTTTNVAITPAPVATAGSSSPTVCENGTIDLTSSGGTSYTWTGPASFTSTSQNPSFAASALAAGTYTVTVTAAGCTDTAITTIGITPLPTINASAAATTVCTGSNIDLTATGATTYSWTGPNTFTSTSQNPGITGATTSASGLYTVTGTSAGCSATDTVIITVAPPPTAAITGTSTICAGQSATLTATGGGTYSWNNSSTSNTITVNPTSTTFYWVTVAIGSCTDSAGINVIVNPLPTATASSTSTLCAGGAINLTSSGGTSYSWSGPGGYTNSTQNPSIPGAATSASGTYTVTVTSSGCTATATTITTVNPAPTITVLGNTTICDLNSTSLTATGAASYTWSTTEITSMIVVAPTATTTYTVTGTSSAGCTATQTVTVTVTAPPVVTITGTTNICSGQSATLTASGGAPYTWSTGATTPTISVTPATTTTYTVSVGTIGCGASTTGTVTVNPSPTAAISGVTTITLGGSTTLTASGGTGYSWTPPTGLSCTACASPTAAPSVTTQYCVTVSNGGCADTACAIVNVDIQCGELFVPTAFSPNGDNENEILYVMGNCIEDLNFAIFDRWGEKVFETSDPTQGWDGTYKGKKLDAAVFVYYLKAKVNNIDVDKHGNITLVK